MKVVYTRAWVLKKPETGSWYPVVFAKELIEQEKSYKRIYQARISSLTTQVETLQKVLQQHIRENQNERTKKNDN